MQIIPDSGRPSGSYWCSWRTQRLSVSDSIIRSKLQERGYHSLYDRSLRETISDEWLFGSPGVVSNYMERIRGDLIVLLDDGWDIPLERNDDRSYSEFGSLEANPRRFPYGDTPKERLAVISDKVKSLGYAGLGLWIPLQAVGERKNELMPLEEFTEYWAERARWCQYAGVRYVKVDWGFHNNNRLGNNKAAFDHCVLYRTGLTRAFRENAPDVMVEHTMVQGSFYTPLDNDGSDFVNRLTDISDVYRLYDISPSFNTVTTLARAAEIMALHTSGCGDGCLVNTGEEPYVAATLGMTMGMMSHPFISGTALSARPAGMVNGIMQTSLLRADFYDYDWYERALLWQRICPPVPLGGCKVNISDKKLTDSWTFSREPYPYYPQKLIGSTMTQTAPAAIARGTRLPEAVSDGYLPYLTAFQHPTSAAYALGMLARTVDGVMNNTVPLASVTAYPGNSDQTIGIFGPCRQIDLVFDTPVVDRRVFLGGMLEAEAADVTSGVSFPSTNVLRIPGSLLGEVGIAGQSADDYSEPASVVRLIGD